ncbi:hypothetical protein UFOVP239_10 [uncultured Caudovirales phage]|uniref:Uncharacterized protein n=1 Tax=uncultured Caudovirales phage TaxID=2100421 RepID=A0A6J7WPV3_9CAUD|nr:hypothetical protein UFOVP239_10 [uncultured Caudovirales phage]
MKALKIESNKAGKRFALVAAGSTFGVYSECLNYSGHCKGGYAVTWRYCEKGLTREAAEMLLTKKAAGKQKP